jgi:6-phosphogluconolactonase (cycloisomerase 2 family)
LAVQDFSAGGVKLPGRRKQMNLHNIRAVSQHSSHGEDRAVLSSLRENSAKVIGFAKRLLPNRFSRMAKVSIVSLAMVLGLSSCSLDYVVGYVYMTTNGSNPGLINQYAIDFQSGALSLIGSAVPAGNNPVRLIASPSGQFIYVINQGDSTVQEFAVQSDGTLVSKNTYPTGGSHPAALAIDPQGKFLYVANSCVSGVTYSSKTNSCTGTGTLTGTVSIFPVNSDNSLGTVSLQAVGNNPVGVVVSYFNHFVYVLDQDPAKPSILSFSQNASTGALSPVVNAAGSLITAAGVVPSAIVEEPTSRFVYVTDQAANQLIGYTVLGGTYSSTNQTAGSLTPMVNGPFQTGLFPKNITIDPQGNLMYVINFNASSVQGYAIDTVTGTPSGVAGAFATATGTGPTCVQVDPALGTFLYTSDSLDNTVTGERLNPSTGALQIVQNSPFPTQGAASAQPTCLTIVPNGAHASQIIYP